MSSGFISHAVIKVSQTLAPWKACWPDEHNQIELSILNNRSGFNPLQRSLQAPINAQISFGLGRNLAFGLLSSLWNACCMAALHGPFHASRCAPYSSLRKIYWKSLRISRLTMRVACTSGRPFPFCASLRELDPRPATFRGRPP